MPDLRVPIGIDGEGRLCPPTSAKKGGDYFCPACGEPVTFRHGRVKVAHFAHRMSSTCSQETIIHRTAKLLIQRAVQEWKLGNNRPPILQRQCRGCRTLVHQPLPEKVDGVTLEHRMVDGSIADVALMAGEEVQAAVEIKVTHAVDSRKAHSIPVPFIELNGNEVAENPTLWKPITDNFYPLTCGRCKSNYSEFLTKVKNVAKASHVEIPVGYFRYGLYRCWKCHMDIVVFAWPEHRLYPKAAPNVTPIPRTIQYLFSKNAGGKYWVNTCPYCHSLQDDFSFYEERGVFSLADHLDEDSPTAFETDMIQIANEQHRFSLRSELI